MTAVESYALPGLSFHQDEDNKLWPVVSYTALEATGLCQQAKQAVLATLGKNDGTKFDLEVFTKHDMEFDGLTGVAVSRDDMCASEYQIKQLKGFGCGPNRAVRAPELKCEKDLVS